MILKLFCLIPWVEIPIFGGKRVAIKSHIDWGQAESIAKAYGIPWVERTVERLSICESEILKQQNEDLEAERDA